MVNPKIHSHTKRITIIDSREFPIRRMVTVHVKIGIKKLQTKPK